MFKILILEDNMSLNTSLTDSLAKKDYQIFQVYTLKRAEILINQQIFDLVIIDRILSDGDGLNLVKYIHQENFPTRILVLSQKSQTTDRITGLNSGADDYLNKPFSLAEFILRVENLLYKYKFKKEACYQLNELQYYPQTGSLLIKNQPIHLRSRENDLLNYLFRYLNSIVTRDKIIANLWQGKVLPNNSTIDVYIRRLRIKLGDYGQYIKTVRSFGYCLKSP